MLATVFETAGSTYSKAGHQMLIAANGDFQGLVSGGCLEGDLAERASRVLDSGEARPVTYDLRDEADELWGLGIGCNGLIRVLLQPLSPADGFEPFATTSRLSLDRARAVSVTVIESGPDQAPPGSCFVWRPGGEIEFSSMAGEEESSLARCAEVSEAEVARHVVEGEGRSLLYAPVRAVPRLLVLGAGLDAVPLVRMATALGWRVSVADHRPGYIEREGFGLADELSLVDPLNLRRDVDLTRFDAVIVMSHHLLTDRAYLEELADLPLRYLGVLGPGARRERLLSDLGETGERLRDRLIGPVGLDIGADSPETIALSILAELQTRFSSPSSALRRAS